MLWMGGFLSICVRSEEHTSELQSHLNLVCRLLLEKKKHTPTHTHTHTKPRTHTSSSTHTQTHAYAIVHEHAHIHRTTTTTPTTHHHLFFLNNPATPEIYPLPQHDPLPI